MTAAGFRLVNPTPRFPPARLTHPTSRGYIHLAVAVEPPNGLVPLPCRSPAKAALLSQLKDIGSQLVVRVDVHRVTVFQAVVVPPRWPGRVTPDRPVRYDVVVLIETVSAAAMAPVQECAEYRVLLAALRAADAETHVTPSAWTTLCSCAPPGPPRRAGHPVGGHRQPNVRWA